MAAAEKLVPRGAETRPRVRGKKGPSFILSPGRDSATHIRSLEMIVADHWLIIEGNLSTHVSRETKLTLTAWSEIQIQLIPKCVRWLNLIEPWWKQVCTLALKGKRFETLGELAALDAALGYWNAHRRPYHWKKNPQQQLPVLALVFVVPLTYLKLSEEAIEHVVWFLEVTRFS